MPEPVTVHILSICQDPSDHMQPLLMAETKFFPWLSDTRNHLHVPEELKRLPQDGLMTHFDLGLLLCSSHLRILTNSRRCNGL